MRTSSSPLKREDLLRVLRRTPADSTSHGGKRPENGVTSSGACSAPTARIAGSSDLPRIPGAQESSPGSPSLRREIRPRLCLSSRPALERLDHVRRVQRLGEPAVHSPGPGRDVVLGRRAPVIARSSGRDGSGRLGAIRGSPGRSVGSRMSSKTMSGRPWSPGNRGRPARRSRRRPRSC